jgi:DNA-binding MarR family transcriptional regulator
MKQVTTAGPNGYALDENGRIGKFITVEQIAAIQREQQNQRDKRHFSFAHMRHIRDITDNLSNKQCGYILMLQPYLQMKSNTIVDPGRDETPLGKAGIAEALGVTAQTAGTIIKSLIQDDVLTVTPSGNYRMNDRYHFRKRIREGKNILVKTFFTTLKELKLKPAELGALYKLLPYIHYETNMVCADPFEVDPAEIRFLNAKQIAGIIGLDDKKTLHILKALKKAEVMAETTRYSKDARVKFITLNPTIFTRQSGQPDASLMAMFMSQEETRDIQ